VKIKGMERFSHYLFVDIFKTRVVYGEGVRESRFYGVIFHEKC